MKYKTATVGLCLLLISGLASASKLNLTAHPMYLEDSEWSDIAQCSIRDKEGFLWIATDYALKRYDGYTLRTFHKDDSNPDAISSTGIFDLLLSSDEELWIAGSALSRYDRETETFTNYNITNYHSIRSVVEDREGSFWLGGEGFGLVIFKPETGKVQNIYFADSPLGAIKKIALHNSKHALWVTSDAGLYLFDIKTSSASKFPLPGEYAGTYISDIANGPSGALWLTTTRGLFVLEEKSRTYKHYAANSNTEGALHTNKLISLARDSKNRMWIGTDKSGALLYQTETDDFLQLQAAEFTKGMLRPGAISDIYEDDEENLWISAGPYGVFRVSENHEKFILYQKSLEFSNSLSFNNVLGMLEDSKGNIWIATDGGGLNKLTPDSGNFKHYRHDPNNKYTISSDSVLDLAEDKYGNIWIGTWGGGLNKLDPKTDHVTRFQKNRNAAKDRSIAGDNIFSVLIMDNGKMLLSVWGFGLQVFDPDTANYLSLPWGKDEYSPSSYVINELTPAADGNIWVISYAGVEKYHPQTGRFEKIQMQLSEGTFGVHEDKTDTLWIVTNTNLIRFRPHINDIKYFTTKDGLSDNYVVSIEEDNLGYLWLATRNGLNKFDPENETFEVFGVNDGLAGAQFNRSSHLKTRDGKLYFGSTDGLTAFNPEQLPINERAPQVHLLGLELFQKAVRPGHSPWLKKPLNNVEQLILPHDQRDISFSFTALNFISPEKNKFRYRLEGLEQDWLDADSRGRRVRYTNLAPGNYSFQILSANNDGVWNGSARSLKLTILPAWWQSWWAMAVYAVAILLAIYAYGQWKLRQNRQREIELKHLVDEQTEQLRRANRSVVQINSELEQRVAHRTRELEQEIEERRESESKVTYIAYHDALTGLYNRSWLLNHLEEVIDDCGQNRYAVFFIGGDRFRKINDTYGHLIGDALLLSAAKRLKSLLPEEYHAVRLGSDEFAVVIDKYTPDMSALALAKKICAEFKQKFILEQINISFGVSIGLVVGNGEYTEPTQILRDANIAMQSAKERGRGTCQMFDDAMLQNNMENAVLESELRNALSRSQFSVVYQPILSMESGKLSGFELLLRWKHPQMGPVPPFKFIAMAESLGLIFDIGIWVIEQACRQLCQWRQSYGTDRLPVISVNLSALQLGQDDLLQQVDKVLKETGAPVRKIKLEITESALMQNTETAEQLLDGLRKRGFELAIDDFGTGYSSLSYLGRLPVQLLKIDRSFISALFEKEEGSGSAHEIVRATISLAHALKMRVVAEGIETQAQYEAVKAYKCDYGQGYLFAKPMSPEAADELLEKHFNHPALEIKNIN